jgi:hypothetical protein
MEIGVVFETVLIHDPVSGWNPELTLTSRYPKKDSRRSAINQYHLGTGFVNSTYGLLIESNFNCGI